MDLLEILYFHFNGKEFGQGWMYGLMIQIQYSVLS